MPAGSAFTLSISFFSQAALKHLLSIFTPFPFPDAPSYISILSTTGQGTNQGIVLYLRKSEVEDRKKVKLSPAYFCIMYKQLSLHVYQSCFE